MKKQRDLFEGDEGESEEILRRLPEEVRARVTALLAELALKRSTRRKEARDDR